MQQLKNQGISELEFIALMAFLMANAALSIDGILPGLNDIGLALNHSNPRDLQSIVTMIFLGLGMGQLVFGTLSDSLGRKPVVYAGVVVFLLASLISVQATTLEMMLFGRFLQGVGLSAPRSVSISIIRDLYEGDYMARIMSFITVIFILVPMIAPILGQFILDIYYWQAIFYFQMFFALVTLIWFGLRLKETVPKSKRIQLTKHLFVDGVKEFFKFKETIIYTLISGLITSSFMVYLSSSKQIFQDQYGLIKEFAYLFAGIAFFLGLATFFNGNLVVKYGMKKLATTALYMFTFSG
ncbi:MAG: DHA1 family bicyclomycin/chloramphenicol resistance-like MFS transporter, partial [Saprospiraceae bacterium]